MMNACLIPFELSEDRLDELLRIWERWMHEPTEKVMELGYPEQATGCHVDPWGYWEDTSALQLEAMEYAKAESVNAAIDDLEPLHRMAIHHKHLAAVFAFHRANLDDQYWEARQALRVVLPGRSIY